MSRANNLAFELTNADRGGLVGVDARLVQLAERLAQISPIPFMITEGVRSYERQRQLYLAGKTRTMQSKHLRGRAIDIVPLVGGKPKWDWKLYAPLIACAKEIARENNLRMEFGYDWGWDAPHMELQDDV